MPELHEDCTAHNIFRSTQNRYRVKEQQLHKNYLIYKNIKRRFFFLAKACVAPAVRTCLQFPPRQQQRKSIETTRSSLCVLWSSLINEYLNEYCRVHFTPLVFMIFMHSGQRKFIWCCSGCKSQATKETSSTVSRSHKVWSMFFRFTAAFYLWGCCAIVTTTFEYVYI